MSKTLTLFLTAAALAFASCSGEETTDATENGAETPEVLSEADAEAQAASEITDADSAEAALAEMEKELKD